VTAGEFLVAGDGVHAEKGVGVHAEKGIGVHAEKGSASMPKRGSASMPKRGRPPVGWPGLSVLTKPRTLPDDERIVGTDQSF
jgi:hypothetical protein